jgi:hypothetical protein
MPVVLGTREAEIRRVLVQGPISTNKKLDMVVHICDCSFMESINRRITIQALPGIKARSYLTNNKSKKG